MNYLTLADAGQLSPGKPTGQQMWRWCARGIKSRNGGRIKLNHTRMGGKVYTTQVWLDEFQVALVKDKEPVAAVKLQRQPKTASQKQRDKRIAEATLALSRT